MLSPRYLVPNGITAFSMLLAIWSIVHAIDGSYDQAAWCTVWCVLLDRMDGVAARLLRASSRFGQEFDSLADLLAFCVAPSVLSYVLLTREARYTPSGLPRSAVLAVIALYFLCGAIRLARYNVTLEDAPGWFRGLPTTFAGGLVASGLLAARSQGFDAAAWGVPLGLPALLAICALLMISTFWMRKEVWPRSRILLGIGISSMVLLYGLGFAHRWPECIFLILVSYSVIGFLIGVVRRPAPRVDHATAAP